MNRIDRIIFPILSILFILSNRSFLKEQMSHASSG